MLADSAHNQNDASDPAGQRCHVGDRAPRCGDSEEPEQEDDHPDDDVLLPGSAGRTRVARFVGRLGSHACQCARKAKGPARIELLPISWTEKSVTD